MSCARATKQNLLGLLSFCALMAVALACGVDAPSSTYSGLEEEQTLAPQKEEQTLAPQAEEQTLAPQGTTQLSAPTPTPEVWILPNPTWRVPPSLEEQIYKADAVVRASLLSASATTETVPAGEGVTPTYRAIHELKFTAHEYLKGTGPSQIAVIVRGQHSYTTKKTAQTQAEQLLSERNTTWDDQQAVIFLKTLIPAYTPDTGNPPAAGSAYGFVQSDFNPNAEWNYTVDTTSRAWLPVQDPGNGNSIAQGADGASVTVITNGSQSPPQVTALADLHSQIVVMNEKMAAGAGDEEYDACIRHMILRERYRRADPWFPYEYAKTLASGSSAGTEILRDDSYNGPKYHHFYVTGPDMVLFQASVKDPDSDPTNGYVNDLIIARPLPAGEYKVHHNTQLYDYMPCNFVPDDSYDIWVVAITAPSGTLHEVLFDPGASGGAVGFTGAAGLLEPAGFTVGGSATTIQELTWQNGTVSLTLSPQNTLTGYVLDFFAVDGTVSLSLDAATATAASGKLTWPVASQPWQDGDHLMLRIRETGSAPILPPTPEPTATPTPARSLPPRPRLRPGGR